MLKTISKRQIFEFATKLMESLSDSKTKLTAHSLNLELDMLSLKNSVITALLPPSFSEDWLNSDVNSELKEEFKLMWQKQELENISALSSISESDLAEIRKIGYTQAEYDKISKDIALVRSERTSAYLSLPKSVTSQLWVNLVSFIRSGTLPAPTQLSSDYYLTPLFSFNCKDKAKVLGRKLYKALRKEEKFEYFDFIRHYGSYLNYSALDQKLIELQNDQQIILEKLNSRLELQKSYKENKRKKLTIEQVYAEFRLNKEHDLFEKNLHSIPTTVTSRLIKFTCDISTCSELINQISLIADELHLFTKASDSLLDKDQLEIPTECSDCFETINRFILTYQNFLQKEDAKLVQFKKLLDSLMHSLAFLRSTLIKDNA